MAMADTALPCLVLIPGTLCDGRLFARQRRALRGVANVVVLDFRRLRCSATWLQQGLRQLPDRFSVAGFSLGGLWALELLRRASERVDRLGLIASNAEAAGTVVRRRSERLWRQWRSVGAVAVARSLKPRYFHRQALRARHASLVSDMARCTSAAAAREQFRWAGSRPSALDLLANWQRSLLIVSGAQDRLCPPALQQRMAQAQPNARWVELPRCGHFIPLEAPARLAGLLRAWLQAPANPSYGD